MSWVNDSEDNNEGYLAAWKEAIHRSRPDPKIGSIAAVGYPTQIAYYRLQHRCPDKGAFWGRVKWTGSESERPVVICIADAYDSLKDIEPVKIDHQPEMHFADGD